MNPNRTQETQRPERKTNRSLRTALTFRVLLATSIVSGAVSGVLDGALKYVPGLGTSQAQAAECVGPNVPCTTPDGIARKGKAEVFRVLFDQDNNAYGVTDAAVRVHIIAANGTSDYPELDKDNPRLDPNTGVAVAFQNKKDGQWRKVGKSIVFKSAEATGKLTNSETGGTTLDLEYGPDAIKDRAIGKSRGEFDCATDDQDCQLNCETTVVWERLKGASKPETFIDSTGKAERDQTAIWMWNGVVKSVHSLVSFTRLTNDRIANLIGLGQAKPTSAPKMNEVRE